MIWSQDFLVRAGFEPVENWQVLRKICFICRSCWGSCMHCHSLHKIEFSSTEDLQDLLFQCFDNGAIPEETLLVEAMSHELAHRARYNFDPARRFTGETK